jgi:hypothetical protein
MQFDFSEATETDVKQAVMDGFARLAELYSTDEQPVSVEEVVEGFIAAFKFAMFLASMSEEEIDALPAIDESVEA